MNCLFTIPLSGPDAAGRCSWKCSRCGLSSAPTAYPPDKINATCRASNQVCLHLGDLTGNEIRCDTCPGNVRLKLFECEVYGECTVGDKVGNVAGCSSGTCPSFTQRGVIGGKYIKRFKGSDLLPGLGKPFTFNASIIRDPTRPGYFLLAFRDGWAGSEIWLRRLGPKLQPIEQPWKLQLRHSKSAYGREDPRLFMHNGRLHIAYAGVKGEPIHTNVLYARLTENCSAVEHNFYPHLPNRQEWEKNWSFFSYDGELHAIYTIAPHSVLRIRGEEVELVSQTDNLLPWIGGERRGGASPILIDNEWWHFFHDRIELPGTWQYRTGVYTFANKPPFQVLRQTREPIMSADLASQGDNYCAVVFTCGAVDNETEFILSSGVHDRWIEIHRISKKEIESKWM